MSKFRLSSTKRTKPVPLSLRPQHIVMLEDLEKKLGKNRSAIVQNLIEIEYEKQISNDLVGRGTNGQ